MNFRCIYDYIFLFISTTIFFLAVQAITELTKSPSPSQNFSELNELIESIFIPDGKYAPVDAPPPNSFSSLTIHSKYPYLMIRVEADIVKDQIYSVRPTSWPEDALRNSSLSSSSSSSSSSSTSPLFDQRNLLSHTFTILIENVSFTNPPIPHPWNSNYLTIQENGHLLLETIEWTKTNQNQDTQPATATDAAAAVSKQRKTILYQKVKSHPLKELLQHHLCSMEDLIHHGKWKLDYTKKVTDEEKWNTCPLYQRSFHYRGYECHTGYHPAHYYSSTCSILPLRVSLRILYQFYEKTSLMKAYQQSNRKQNKNFHYYYYTFIGDSLNGQLASSGRCELENHHFLAPQPSPSSLSSPSSTSSASSSASSAVKHNASSGFSLTIHPMWNQYLRDDLPCHPQCLTNDTFTQTDGKRKKNYYLPPPCKGCPNGQQKFIVTPSEVERLFIYLEKIPRETRILVINSGAWYTEYYYVHNGTTLFRETLILMLPFLAQLQQKRGYSLDIYFLTLPSFRSNDLAISNKLFQWDEYGPRNHIVQEVFSPFNLRRYNLTVTVIPNDKIFHKRKGKVDGQFITTHDRLHYCAPGVFSPPSLLFELILHLHIKNRLQRDGYVSYDTST